MPRTHSQRADKWYLQNPCCFFELQGGTIVIGIVDSIMGAVTLSLAQLYKGMLSWQIAVQFIPGGIPYSEIEFVRVLEQFGVWMVMLVGGVLISFTARFASYQATYLICIPWVVLHFLSSIVTFEFSCKLIATRQGSDNLVVYGVVLLFMTFLLVYIYITVMFYGLEAYDDYLHSYTAVNPYQFHLNYQRTSDPDIHPVEAVEDDVMLVVDDNFTHAYPTSFVLAMTGTRNKRLGLASRTDSYNEMEYRSYLKSPMKSISKAVSVRNEENVPAQDDAPPQV